MATGKDDVWALYVDRDDLRDIVEEAMAKTVALPIVPQFYPSRGWLWSRWKGTILRKVLPREVLWNVVLVGAIWITIRMLPEPVQMVAKTKIGKAAASAVPDMPSSLMRTLASVDKVSLQLTAPC